MFLPCLPCCGGGCSFPDDLSDSLQTIFDSPPSTLDVVVDSTTRTFTLGTSTSTLKLWSNFDPSFPIGQRTLTLFIEKRFIAGADRYAWRFTYRTGWYLESQTCDVASGGGGPVGDPYNPFNDGAIPAGADTVKLCGNDGVSTTCYEIALPQGGAVGDAGLFPGNPDYSSFTVDWLQSASVIKSDSFELPSGWYT